MPHAGHLQFQVPLLGQVVEGPDHAVPRQADRSGSPRPRRVGTRSWPSGPGGTKRPGTFCRSPSKCAQDFGRRFQRLELIGGIERRAALQVAQQLQVRQQRADHREADVVGARQFVLADVELRALAKHLAHQRPRRRSAGACRRRRSSPARSDRRGRRTFRTPTAGRRARPGRSPGHSFPGSWADCSGRRSGCRPCRCPCRRRSWPPRCRGPRRGTSSGSPPGRRPPCRRDRAGRASRPACSRSASVSAVRCRVT